MNEKQRTLLRQASWVWLIVFLAIAGYIFVFGDQTTTQAKLNPVVNTTVERNDLGRTELDRNRAGVAHQPIEEIRVGDRVMAHNPEVSADERASWIEPDWSDYLKRSSPTWTNWLSDFNQRASEVNRNVANITIQTASRKCQ